MEKWFQVYIAESVENLTEEIGRLRGKSDAYKDIAEHQDPEKYCPICGYHYKTWGDAAGQAESKAKHDAEHQPKPTA